VAATGANHTTTAGRKVIIASRHGGAANHTLLKLGLVAKMFKEMEFKIAENEFPVTSPT